MLLLLPVMAMVLLLLMVVAVVVCKPKRRAGYATRAHLSLMCQSLCLWMATINGGSVLSEMQLSAPVLRWTPRKSGGYAMAKKCKCEG